jgi:hypothetical protein
MPTSKHRRRGKARPRAKIADFQPPTLPPPSPEELAEMAKEAERDRETEKLVCARLREIHAPIENGLMPNMTRRGPSLRAKG